MTEVTSVGASTQGRCRTRWVGVVRPCLLALFALGVTAAVIWRVGITFDFEFAGTPVLSPNAEGEVTRFPIPAWVAQCRARVVGSRAMCRTMIDRRSRAEAWQARASEPLYEYLREVDVADMLDTLDSDSVLASAIDRGTVIVCDRHDCPGFSESFLEIAARMQAELRRKGRAKLAIVLEAIGYDVSPDEMALPLSKVELDRLMDRLYAKTRATPEVYEGILLDPRLDGVLLLPGGYGPSEFSVEDVRVTRSGNNGNFPAFFAQHHAQIAERVRAMRSRSPERIVVAVLIGANHVTGFSESLDQVMTVENVRPLVVHPWVTEINYLIQKRFGDTYADAWIRVNEDTVIAPFLSDYRCPR